MKKFILLCAAVLLLSACGSEEVQKEEPKQKKEQITEKKIEKKEAAPKKETTVGTKEEQKQEEDKIDTSVFVYAKKVEVTDARDTTQHVTVFVHMSKEPTPGLATQHILNQTYSFIQQPDLEGAKTITVAVKQGELKIAQITLDKGKFVPNDTEPMIKAVLTASVIDSMIAEVKEYGTTMGTW